MAMGSKGQGQAGSVVGKAVGVGIAAILVAMVVLIAGALTLLATGGLSSAGLRLGLAATVALAGALVVPLLLDRAMTRAYRKVDPNAPSTRRQVLGIWNGLLAALALFAFPGTTRQALTHHGHWLLEGAADGSSTGLGRRIGRLASHIPRSDGADGAAEPASSAAATAALPSAPEPSEARSAAPAVASAAPPAGPPPIPDHDLSPEEVFRLRAAAVVVIATRQTISKDDEAYALYERLGAKTVHGFGSGFVVDPKGLVVTNHHVVDGAESLQITFRNEQSYPDVEVLATDRAHDLALLAIGVEGLASVPLAPDEALTPGARAIAIGAPLGLEYSVTDGIVSAVRDIQGTTFLQMQTTIAPGSSGGPLFDVRGRVMGVNTATRGGGLNLAVHVKHVRALLGLERKPTRLARYVPGARIDKMTFEGGDASPVERMQLAEALKLLAVGAESCIDTAPAAPFLTLQLSARGRPGFDRGPDATVTNLGEQPQRCLETNLQLTAGLVAMIMREIFAAEIRADQPVAVVLDVVGLRAREIPDGGLGERTLAVRFQMGKPAAPPAP